jgi:hypothetical protein
MLADMCAALGMNIIYTSRHRKDVPYEHVGLDELYARADCVVLTCPLTEETKGMINREAISKMKDGVVLVNVGAWKVHHFVGGPGRIRNVRLLYVDVLIEPQREARWSRKTTWSRRLRAEKVRTCKPASVKHHAEVASQSCVPHWTYLRTSHRSTQNSDPTPTS